MSDQEVERIRKLIEEHEKEKRQINRIYAVVRVLFWCILIIYLIAINQ